MRLLYVEAGMRCFLSRSGLCAGTAILLASSATVAPGAASAQSTDPATDALIYGATYDSVGDSTGPVGSDIESAIVGYNSDAGSLKVSASMAPDNMAPTVRVRIAAGSFTPSNVCDATDGVTADVINGGRDTEFRLPGNPTPVIAPTADGLRDRPELKGRSFNCVKAESLSESGDVYDDTLAGVVGFGTTPVPPPTAQPTQSVTSTVPTPVPATTRKVTLKGAHTQRLSALRFTAAANIPGTYRVTARVGAVTVRRTLTFRRAGSTSFRLSTTAAQNRQLRRARARGTVQIRVSITGYATTATTFAMLRR